MSWIQIFFKCNYTFYCQVGPWSPECLAIFFFWVSPKGKEGRDGRLGDGLSDVWSNKWSDSKMALNDQVKLSRRYLHCRGVSVLSGWQPQLSGQQKWAETNQRLSAKEPKAPTVREEEHKKAEVFTFRCRIRLPSCTSVRSDPTLSQLEEAHNLILRQFSWHSYSERNSNKYKITPSNIQRTTFYF